MDKEIMKSFVLALRRLPIDERRAEVERALRIADNRVTFDDLRGMKASDVSGTWDKPALWGDADSLTDAK